MENEQKEDNIWNGSAGVKNVCKDTKFKGCIKSENEVFYDAETGEALRLNTKCEFMVEFEKADALKPDEYRWTRPYVKENTPQKMTTELVNLRRRNHEYLANILQQEKENEKKREVQWHLERNPTSRALLRKKFKRDRLEARNRIERIMQENEASLAARLAEANLIR